MTVSLAGLPPFEPSPRVLEGRFVRHEPLRNEHAAALFTVFYSVVAGEWPAVRERVDRLIDR